MGDEVRATSNLKEEGRSLSGREVQALLEESSMGVGVGRSCGKCDVYVGEGVVWAHNGIFFFFFFRHAVMSLDFFSNIEV